MEKYCNNLLTPFIYNFSCLFQMVSNTEHDELKQILTENRHLKNTINALRETMEKMQIDKEDCIQKAVVEANSEIIQLKSTITALRETLEKKQILYEEKIQEIELKTRNEIKQLQQTIVNLRQLLEESNAKSKE